MQSIGSIMKILECHLIVPIDCIKTPHSASHYMRIFHTRELK
uniref:Uncharacterized protein n=1 Tax=Anguilla anguilla TaxID=7936 RepID=A0A0E9TJ17_ANGAN